MDSDILHSTWSWWPVDCHLALNMILMACGLSFCTNHDPDGLWIVILHWPWSWWPVDCHFALSMILMTHGFWHVLFEVNLNSSYWDKVINSAKTKTNLKKCFFCDTFVSCFVNIIFVVSHFQLISYLIDPFSLSLKDIIDPVFNI